MRWPSGTVFMKRPLPIASSSSVMTSYKSGIQASTKLESYYSCVNRKLPGQQTVPLPELVPGFLESGGWFVWSWCTTTKPFTALRKRGSWTFLAAGKGALRHKKTQCSAITTVGGWRHVPYKLGVVTRPNSFWRSLTIVTRFKAKYYLLVLPFFIKHETGRADRSDSNLLYFAASCFTTVFRDLVLADFSASKMA